MEGRRGEPGLHSGGWCGGRDDSTAEAVAYRGERREPGTWGFRGARHGV